MNEVFNIKLVSGGDMIDKTTTYIITILLGKKYEFSCDVSFNPNDVTFALFDRLTESTFIELLNNLNRAFRNKFIGQVKVTYDTEDTVDRKCLSVTIDGYDIQI